MARTRESKENILEQLKSSLLTSSAVIFVSMKGLTVKESQDLRKQCHQVKTRCIMAKKTLLSKAFKERNIDGINFKQLEGEIAVVFSFADEVTPAKITAGFRKSHEQFEILGGVSLGGPQGVQLLNAEDVRHLAQLPSREELLGMLVGTIASPLRGLAGVLHGPLRGIVYVLSGISAK
ncbi:50S ribosomal protein L10 [Candidatus Uhrbacteria bacterium]|nr:50S ribosomal protein L10 [Candidatus Uhrbacteria bacterium]